MLTCVVKVVFIQFWLHVLIAKPTLHTTMHNFVDVPMQAALLWIRYNCS